MNQPLHRRARKRFGQHFLHDPRVIDQILRAFNPTAGENIVEIGPGRGVLTGRLLAIAGKLDVVELDRDLAAELPARMNHPPGLTVHGGDALDFDFRRLAGNAGRLRVIGNLPYNVSTPLIFHLLEQSAAIDDMLFMLQREVVDRMTAKPGSKVYGRLTVMTGFACSVERLFAVGSGAFQPAPKVESAVVRLLPHRTPPWPVADGAVLDQVVRRAFAQRRKTLRNSLAGLISPAGLEALGIDPGSRAEQLDPAGYAALANAVAGHNFDPV